MCFSVGVGRNALAWFQPSASGKEIVLRPLPLPPHSIRGRALPQMRQNGPDRFRIASGSVTSAITRSVPPHSGQTGFSGGLYCRFLRCVARRFR